MKEKIFISAGVVIGLFSLYNYKENRRNKKDISEHKVLIGYILIIVGLTALVSFIQYQDVYYLLTKKIWTLVS